MNKLDLLVETSVYLLNNFDGAKETKQYLNGRISEDIQKEYSFGYLPPNSNLNLLTDILTTSFLEEISIIYKKTIAGAITNCSFFNNHNLVFPFKNHNNETVAIIARTLLSSERQKELEIGRYKYSINYDKELYTFGLNKSKSSIIDKNFVICVEGQFDYFALISKGISNCIALGCANMTKYQFFEINKYTNNIFLMFDNDIAGINGMKKVKREYGKYANIKIISPVEGFKDIDDFIRNCDDSVRENYILQCLTSGFGSFNGKETGPESRENRIQVAG